MPPLDDRIDTNVEMIYLVTDFSFLLFGCALTARLTNHHMSTMPRPTWQQSWIAARRVNPNPAAIRIPGGPVRSLASASARLTISLAKRARVSVSGVTSPFAHIYVDKCPTHKKPDRLRHRPPPTAPPLAGPCMWQVVPLRAQLLLAGRYGLGLTRFERVPWRLRVQGTAAARAAGAAWAAAIPEPRTTPDPGTTRRAQRALRHFR